MKCGLIASLCCLIQTHVQFENIDSGFTQDAELSFFSVLAYKLPHFVLAHSAFASNSWNLKLSRCRADVRIKP